MASTGFGTAFRHLRDLFGAGTVVGPGRRPAPGPVRRLEGRGGVRGAGGAGTGRWSWRSAGPSSGTSTTSRTPSRPPSWSWPGRPARSGRATPWAAGCTGSPTGSASRPSVEAKRRRRSEAEASAMATPDASRPGPEPDSRPDPARGDRPAARAPSPAGRALRPGGPDLRAGRRAAPLDRADAPLPAGGPGSGSGTA